MPHQTSPPPRATKAPDPADVFAGLEYSEDQKTKISKIREDMRARRDGVIKDDKLSPEQKDAFLQGFQRMERSEVYQVLTPEQKTEVNKRMAALRRDAEKQRENRKVQQPPG